MTKKTQESQFNVINEIKATSMVKMAVSVLLIVCCFLSTLLNSNLKQQLADQRQQTQSSSRVLQWEVKRQKEAIRTLELNLTPGDNEDPKDQNFWSLIYLLVGAFLYISSFVLRYGDVQIVNYNSFDRKDKSAVSKFTRRSKGSKVKLILAKVLSILAFLLMGSSMFNSTLQFSNLSDILAQEIFKTVINYQKINTIKMFQYLLLMGLNIILLYSNFQFLQLTDYFKKLPPKSQSFTSLKDRMVQGQRIKEYLQQQGSQEDSENPDNKQNKGKVANKGKIMLRDRSRILKNSSSKNTSYEKNMDRNSLDIVNDNEISLDSRVLNERKRTAENTNLLPSTQFTNRNNNEKYQKSEKLNQRDKKGTYLIICKQNFIDYLEFALNMIVSTSLYVLNIHSHLLLIALFIFIITNACTLVFLHWQTARTNQAQARYHSPSNLVNILVSKDSHQQLYSVFYTVNMPLNSHKKQELPLIYRKINKAFCEALIPPVKPLGNWNGNSSLNFNENSSQGDIHININNLYNKYNIYDSQNMPQDSQFQKNSICKSGMSNYPNLLRLTSLKPQLEISKEFGPAEGDFLKSALNFAKNFDLGMLQNIHPNFQLEFGFESLKELTTTKEQSMVCRVRMVKGIPEKHKFSVFSSTYLLEKIFGLIENREYLEEDDTSIQQIQNCGCLSISFFERIAVERLGQIPVVNVKMNKTLKNKNLQNSNKLPTIEENLENKVNEEGEDSEIEFGEKLHTLSKIIYDYIQYTEAKTKGQTEKALDYFQDNMKNFMNVEDVEIQLSKESSQNADEISVAEEGRPNEAMWDETLSYASKNMFSNRDSRKGWGNQTNSNTFIADDGFLKRNNLMFGHPAGQEPSINIQSPKVSSFEQGVTLKTLNLVSENQPMIAYSVFKGHHCLFSIEKCISRDSSDLSLRLNQQKPQTNLYVRVYILDDDWIKSKVYSYSLPDEGGLEEIRVSNTNASPKVNVTSDQKSNKSSFLGVKEEKVESQQQVTVKAIQQKAFNKVQNWKESNRLGTISEVNSEYHNSIARHASRRPTFLSTAQEPNELKNATFQDTSPFKSSDHQEELFNNDKKFLTTNTIYSFDPIEMKDESSSKILLESHIKSRKNKELIVQGGSINNISKKKSQLTKSSEINSCSRVNSTNSKIETSTQNGKSEEVSKLLSLIAHEIRAPIKGVMTLMDHCIRYYPEKEQLITSQDKDIEYCLSKSTTLLSILLETCSCILDIVKPVQAPIKYIEFDFIELCNDVRELFNSDIDQKQLKFNLDYKATQWIRSEPVRLRQILINLVSNAIKYSTMGGSLTIQVVKCCDRNIPCDKHPKITEQLEDENMDIETEMSSKLGCNQVIEIRVKDTGLGIKKKDLSKLFREFGRVMNEHDIIMNKGGVGLGLNLSNKLAQMLSPENSTQKGIQVESEWKKGTEFFFYIEDKFRDDLERKVGFETEKKDINWIMLEIFKNRDNPQNNLGQKFKDMICNKYYYLNKGYSQGMDAVHPRVLVVDDSDFMLKIIETNFLKLEVKVDCFLSPYEALDSVMDRFNLKCKLCRTYDLIIVDYEMPFMDGKEFMIALRNKSEYKDSFIVLASADKKEGEDVIGFNGVMTKPLGMKDLKILINNLSNIRKDIKCTCTREHEKEMSDRDMGSIEQYDYRKKGSQKSRVSQFGSKKQSTWKLSGSYKKRFFYNTEEIDDDDILENQSIHFQPQSIKNSEISNNTKSSNREMYSEDKKINQQKNLTESRLPVPSFTSQVRSTRKFTSHNYFKPMINRFKDHSTTIGNNKKVKLSTNLTLNLGNQKVKEKQEEFANTQIQKAFSSLMYNNFNSLKDSTGKKDIKNFQKSSKLMKNYNRILDSSFKKDFSSMRNIDTGKYLYDSNNNSFSRASQKVNK